ncbi:kinase-like domain-containing protein [Schizothecium vesticola]|uniref:non-specific serine/threonine protein kinase n=1 Tax=Schizothecium vesticola TaxID=314040 RepID=A0AA40K0G0_9PEZI|nr:kinase-like domain-containing protein [Schizothecium vesticola]
MNGDLSLSQALGGLRIANPDDASSSPLREQSAEPGTVPDRTSTPPDAGIERASPYTPSRHPQGAGAEPSSRPPHSFETAAAILKTAQHSLNTTQQNLNAARGLSQPPSSHEHNPEPQYGLRQSASVGGRLPGQGHSSRSSQVIDPDQLSGPYAGIRNEPSRSSLYGVPPRADPRYDSAGTAPPASREPGLSYHQIRQGPGPAPPPASGSAMLPPRRSSKGMGVGYASIPGVPNAPNGSHMSEGGQPPPSSEEWKDRGAAVSLRREVDSQGRTVIKSVKKGVRDFAFGKVLGEGSYSTVYFATDRQTLREYAVKVLEKKHIIKEKKIKYVNIEKNTLNRLTEHPGIVRLYYTFQDESSLYYVLDLCSGGELLGVLKKTGTFDVECARFYGAQILDSIEYMHSRGVIHRDLKPENVLLNEKMHIKITDFGTAKLLPDPRDPRPPPPSGDPGQSSSQEEKRNASFVGTAEYVSPELLTDKTAGKPSDIWAFGCIIFQLLVGRPPFKAGTEYLTFQKIVGLEYDFPAGFPPAARDLVERCLVLDPSRRLTVEHIKNHEFFDGQSFGEELWRMKAPRLRPYIPPAQEPSIIQLNGGGGASSSPRPISTARSPQAQGNGTTRPARIITELPPPTQLDIEWSPVLTRNNERILKLGDLMVISSPIPNSGSGKGDGDGHKKLSRFFGGSTTKKRQRLVMITSSGRIVLAPAGGEEKRSKQEISLVGPDCVWRTQLDAKGQTVWCVDTNGTHYTFEEPKGSQGDANEWIESLERAKALAVSQHPLDDNGINDFGMASSAMSSPASTMGGRSTFLPDDYSSIHDHRSGRNQLTKSQASLEDQGQGGGQATTGSSSNRRNRFSKRQSKNGLGAQF